MKHGWEYKKLGDCFPFIKNGANIKQIKGADGLPITRIETLSGGVFNRDRMGYAGIYNLDKYSDYVLEDGDLLLSHINSKTYIGRTVEYRAKNDETIIHGMNLLRLKSNLDVINSSFFAYYTLSNDFKTNVAKVRKDAVNQSSIAISDIRKFSIPVPPIHSQQYVVDELDKINELIRLKKEQLKDYDNLAQSIFYEMFGDPVVNEKGWEVKKFSEVASFKNGLNFGKNENGYSYKILGVGDFKDNYVVNSSSLQYINLNDELSSDYFLKPEDIVFVRSNGSKELVGRCVSVDCTEPTTYSGFCIRCRLNENTGVLPMYLLYVCKNKGIREYLTQSGRGCNISNVNQKILNSTDIIIPPLSKQELFIQRIELIEKQKAEIQSTIADLETLLASRMQYWFD